MKNYILVLVLLTLPAMANAGLTSNLISGGVGYAVGNSGSKTPTVVNPTEVSGIPVKCEMTGQNFCKVRNRGNVPIVDMCKSIGDQYVVSGFVPNGKNFVLLICKSK